MEEFISIPEKDLRITLVPLDIPQVIKGVDLTKSYISKERTFLPRDLAIANFAKSKDIASLNRMNISELQNMVRSNKLIPVSNIKSELIEQIKSMS